MKEINLVIFYLSTIEYCLQSSYQRWRRNQNYLLQTRDLLITDSSGPS